MIIAWRSFDARNAAFEAAALSEFPMVGRDYDEP